jgi:hypothetical protein
VPVDSDVLEGQNVLGRLLMELRDLSEGSASAADMSPLAPVGIRDFNLMGRPIGALVVEAANVTESLPQTGEASPRLFDNF